MSDVCIKLSMATPPTAWPLRLARCLIQLNKTWIPITSILAFAIYRRNFIGVCGETDALDALNRAMGQRIMVSYPGMNRECELKCEPTKL